MREGLAFPGPCGGKGLVMAAVLPGALHCGVPRWGKAGLGFKQTPWGEEPFCPPDYSWLTAACGEEKGAPAGSRGLLRVVLFCFVLQGLAGRPWSSGARQGPRGGAVKHGSRTLRSFSRSQLDLRGCSARSWDEGGQPQPGRVEGRHFRSEDLVLSLRA